jgi:hypothetical protein
MKQRTRWLIVLPSVIAVAAIAVGTWQVVSTRSELDAARHQLTNLRATDAKQLAQSRGEETAAKSALATATQSVKHLQYLSTTTTTTPCPYVFQNGSGQTLCSGGPVLTDSNVLVQALDNASGQLTGMAPGAAQEQAFVAQFQSDQTQQERNGALGKAWSVLDPTAEANAYINANDQQAVMAARMAAAGAELNCIAGGGGPNCPAG